MKLSVKRVDVWMAIIEDRAGGAAHMLETLAIAGANFEFVLARRTPEQPGAGVVFVWPVKGVKVIRAAREAGFAKSAQVNSLRIEGRDMPGLGARIARVLGDAGISFRGLAASALGKTFVCYISLDSSDDAAKAAAKLKRLT